MGWLFRKSLRVLPGLRLNLGRKRTTFLIGPPGIKYNIGPGRGGFQNGIGLSRWVIGSAIVGGLSLLVMLAKNQSISEWPSLRDTPSHNLVSPTPAPNILSKQSSQPAAEKIVGKARVVDGDTITINTTQIRLEGIDAPESEQICLGANGSTWQCGKTATQHLSSLLKGLNVSCEKSGEDQYGRTLAVCKLADGTNINARMVSNGVALAFVRYSTRYLSEEREAKNAKRGLWAGKFDAPWDWRARKRLTINNTSPNPQTLLSPQSVVQLRANCLIKGNINRTGERIYHVPGSKWYDRTQINERSGERWFCSVAEAEAAGWRAARGRN